MQKHSPRPTLQFTLAVLYALPILALVINAFAVRWFFPQLWPQEWSTGPFVRQLTDPRTREALLSSAGIGALTALFAVLIGYPAARALGTRRFAGRGLLLALLFLPTVLPPVAIGMGLNIALLRAGLAGGWAGVILSHLIPALPYTVLALAAVFTRYDAGYELQATSLGMPPGRVLLQVTLPLIWPGLITAAVFAFLTSWSQYLLTLLVGGGQVVTIPLLLFAAASGGSPTTVAALAVLAALPPALAVLLVGRSLDSAGVHV